MQNRRLMLWATLLLVAMLVLSGCAPRAGAGEAAAQATDPMELVVDLPAIVVDIQADGSPTIGNVPVAQLGALAGADLSTLAVPKEWVDYMVGGNIQHVQVNNRPDGLLLLVNGEAIPSVNWDGESLAATADVLSQFGMAVPMLEKVLGLVDQIGIGVIVRFPVQAGVAQIPLYVEGDGSAAMAAKAAQEEFLAAVGAPPRINLPVFYGADGSWEVGGLTDAEWTALTGAPLNALRLSPTVLSSLSNAGVETLGISTDIAGIHISINGKSLPTLDWSEGKATHLLDVADQLGLWSMVAPGMDIGGVLTTVEELLPVVQTADFDLTVHLPAGMAAAR
ncbi:MAG: hypothetical protein D6790_05085 [Caldilineae bacterium]|nr:MAG: hypothetical protein D6790_05085 [Caldilineae bacterium]